MINAMPQQHHCRSTNEEPHLALFFDDEDLFDSLAILMNEEKCAQRATLVLYWLQSGGYLSVPRLLIVTTPEYKARLACREERHEEIGLLTGRGSIFDRVFEPRLWRDKTPRILFSTCGGCRRGALCNPVKSTDDYLICLHRKILKKS